MRLSDVVEPGGRVVMTLVHGSEGAYSMFTRWLITFAHSSCLTFSVQLLIVPEQRVIARTITGWRNRLHYAFR